jgi:hypothetical protein
MVNVLYLINEILLILKLKIVFCKMKIHYNPFIFNLRIFNFGFIWYTRNIKIIYQKNGIYLRKIFNVNDILKNMIL